MFCPKCGTQVADGVLFCRKCGAQLGAAQPQQYQQPAYQQPQYQQQEKPKNTKKIILIILAIAVVYGALQIINSIVNKDEPSVKYRPNHNEASNNRGMFELHRRYLRDYNNGNAGTTTKTATLNYSNIKISIDGKEIIPTDVNGNYVAPFAMDGTTYLPVRNRNERGGFHPNLRAQRV